MENVKSFFKKAYSLLDSGLNFIHKYFKLILDNGGIFIFAAILLALSLFMRLGSYDIVTNDVNGFLRNWYTNFYNEGASALGKTIGDYTPAYMYILYFISLFKFEPESIEFVYAIKTVSILFDYLSCVFVFLICKKITKNNYLSVACSGVFLFAPTIFLNSAFWGQCDGIYVSFIIMSIYFLLNKKNHLSFIFLSLAFCFKLQTIFIVPLFLIMCLKNKAKFRYFLYIPVIYLLVALPSIILGRSFSEIINVYINQTTNSYNQLTLNSSTFYSLIYHNFTPHEELSKYGVCLAIGIVGIFMYLIYALKIKITDRLLVTIALFFSVLMPFFMPHMHERYFYLADALCIIYLFLNPKKCYVTILCLLSSLMCYMLYLFSIKFFIDTITTLRLGAIFYIIVLVVLAKEIFTSEKEVDVIEVNN